MTNPLEIKSDWVAIPKDEDAPGQVPRAGLLLSELGIAWRSRLDAAGRVFVSRKNGGKIPDSVIEEM